MVQVATYKKNSPGQFRNKQTLHNPKPTMSDLIVRDLEGMSLNDWVTAQVEQKEAIKTDVMNQIKQRTDFNSYATTPDRLRKPILHAAIGFILYNV